MFRPDAALAVLCSLWLPLCSSDQLFANTTAISRQDDGSSQRQRSLAPKPATRKKVTRVVRPPQQAERRLNRRQLILGGFFVGYVDLPASRPLPHTAPSDEEMKAAITPPEFRTPPTVPLGWLWKGRRQVQWGLP